MTTTFNLLQYIAFKECFCEHFYILTSLHIFPFKNNFYHTCIKNNYNYLFDDTPTNACNARY